MRHSSRFHEVLKRCIRNPFTLGVAMGLVLNLALVPALHQASAQPSHSTPGGSASPSIPTPFPWDPALFNEIFGFPRVVHEAVFGVDPGTDYLPYTLDQQVTAEGFYAGSNGAGTPFTLEVTAILRTAAEVAQDMQDDPDLDPVTALWMVTNNYECYGIRAFIHGPAGSADVIGSVHSTDSPGFGEHHSFSVQSDPAYFDDPTAATWNGGANTSADRSGGCGDAMERALAAFDCPDGIIVVDPDCVEAAMTAYDLAVWAAQQDWQAAVDAAQAAYEAAKAALLAWKIAKLALQLAACAALAAIPFVGSGLAARCAIRVIAKFIAIEIAKRLAIKAALAAAIALADEILEAALNAACDALVAALEACFDCIEIEDPEEPTEIDHSQASGTGGVNR